MDYFNNQFNNINYPGPTVSFDTNGSDLETNNVPNNNSANYVFPENYASYVMPPIRGPMEVHLENHTSKTEDAIWLETWLSKKGKIQLNLNSFDIIPQPPKKTPAPPKIQLNVAKKSLSNCMEILNKLQELKNDLQDNVGTLSSAIWKQKTIEIGILKESFTKLVNTFDSKDVINGLRKSVNDRRKKRKNAKARKVRRREEIRKENEWKIKLNNNIDQWLEAKKDEAERAKMEENMDKDLDCVLAEVTKKKSDARKQLSLITALVKLRFVRETMATQRGERPSLEDKQAFAVTTEKLVKMWENSMKTYGDEEHMLKTMLEKNVHETKKNQQLSKEKDIIRQWEKVLYGPKTVIPQDNYIYWALTAAERDVHTFIAIRKSWDTFLTSNSEGSSIPIGWILPPKSSEKWSPYLEH